MSNRSPIIRAGTAHAAALSVLHKAVFPHAAWDESAFLALLGQPGTVAFIHRTDGFLLLRLVLDEAEILTFGTTQKRQGIGSVLMHEGLAALEQAQIQTLYLEVAAHNESARLFYEKFGFTVIGRRKAYYEDGDDALTMCLSCQRSEKADNHG